MKTKMVPLATVVAMMRKNGCADSSIAGVKNDLTEKPVTLKMPNLIQIRACEVIDRNGQAVVTHTRKGWRVLSLSGYERRRACGRKRSAQITAQMQRRRERTQGATISVMRTPLSA